MRFCTTCGRQRAGESRFCAGCGAEFGNALDATPQVEETSEQQAPAAETAAQWVPGAETAAAQPAPGAEPIVSGAQGGETAADAGQPDLTRWDTHWYREDSAPAPVPAGQAGYGPPSYAQGSPGQGSYGQAPYQPPPHVPGTAGGPPLRRGQTGILIAVLIVVLLAVGGGAYALVSRYTGHKTAASPSGQPTQPAASSAPTTPSGSTPSASPTASPTASSNGVIVAPGVSSNPAVPGVVAFVNRYFTAINSHDYAAYNSLLVPKLRAINTHSDFETGYGTTTDSAQTLTSLTGTSGGGEAATLTFTSNQSPAESPTKTSCTHWTITLYLEPNGGSYLIASAPSGYHAAYQAC